MSAEVGTRVQAPSGNVYTKVAEGSWQHSNEPEPKTVADGPGYALAISNLELIASGALDFPGFELLGVAS